LSDHSKYIFFSCKDYSDDDIEAMGWQKKTSLVQKDPVTCSRFFDHRVQQFIKIVLKSDHHPIGKVTDYFMEIQSDILGVLLFYMFSNVCVSAS
jgi:hypothetical protein